MRIAIVDLGTNTFNLLIAETREGGKYEMLYNEKTPVRLGEGGINKGFITETAFQRGLTAMLAHQNVIHHYKAERVAAFGTSALRNASNGADFVKAVKAETGIDILVIDGNREAELIYCGVRDAVNMSKELSLIIDIGGGSTEFIIADDEKIYWKQSFEIGAARLLEKFRPSDPMTQQEEDRIRDYLDTYLQPLYLAAREFPPTEMIGSTGSFESLAEMIAHRFYSPEMIEGLTEYTYNIDECEIIYHELKRSTHAERLQMKGLIPMRVDMMVVSAILVQHVIEVLQITRMRYSSYSLKEGAIRELIDKGGV
ncbi:MAG: exopolyphosphatase [Bacteroidetes bacterium]|nr:MAG: exopolyphosphatase [Bacteroidota bacterium]